MLVTLGERGKVNWTVDCTEPWNLFCFGCFFQALAESRVWSCAISCSLKWRLVLLPTLILSISSYSLFLQSFIFFVCWGQRWMKRNYLKCNITDQITKITNIATQGKCLWISICFTIFVLSYKVKIYLNVYVILLYSKQSGVYQNPWSEILESFQLNLLRLYSNSYTT